MSELTYYDLRRTNSMSPSLPVQVAKELGRRIVAGTFVPGTLIDDENKLAERYQVSRVVVRDAVKILVGKGLLDVRRGIGTRVKPRNNWALLDDDVLAWHLSAPLNPDFLTQLMEFRLAFEPKAASLAALNATEEDIQAITQALAEMEASTSDVDRFVIADAHFHSAILKASHNELFISMECVIFSALLVSIRVTNQNDAENKSSIPFHKEVFDAIKAKDSTLAQSLTETLLSDAKARLVELM
ncbi:MULTISPECIES: FadR/GntR family transcriptional regulator [unclassified Shewanella]|uniref:FadR/GntR family transcriptional regulator n=1 Tax=unclassified Shewanella TaxID=196818 RepID=UPI000C853D33|nr:MULTISPECIES: FadR/GntR family transcriptional regulator [unclassified Shewanella]MDO6680110.1 FadR/GntR family transcriptional regulator [Shewanella sp. 4_MG-2023]MDO6777008.1 FadR/GntR family transcriptional regulator [Shewanella sp. 3_MG-2023]PMG28340.1 GntR family transcriptional regulator [Shewanella sp. 10N.286.52.C2]PMG47352.1 GntR family transcriptional regulator [Shewanella sp. 10N.286.52.B9]PMH89405.1 GntR family transcriptional regulator [Shewanella sp. 10N.286.48.B5]